ncbi:MAG: PQQ-binding-like beta-propeller repeat protein [Thermoplasmatota archaeon]
MRSEGRWKAYTGSGRSRGYSITVLVALSVAIPLLISYPASGYDTDAWSFWRGTLDHAGTSSGPNPSEGELRWSRTLGDQVLSSPSFYPGGMVIGSDDGWLYCFDPDLGDLNWKFRTGGEVQATALIVGNRAYFGSFDRKFYCIEIPLGDNRSQPSEVWSFETEGQIMSSAHLFDGSLFFGCHDGFVYRLSPDGDLEWKSEITGQIWASPLIDAENGRLYIGNIQGGYHCIHTGNGSLIWSAEVSEVYSSGCLYEGMVFIPGGEDYTFWAFDADDGSVTWRFDLGFAAYSTPAASGGRIYLGSFEYAWCLPVEDPDNSGLITDEEIIWSSPTHDFQGGSSPLIVGDRMYIGSDDYNLYCLRISDGGLLWNFSTSGYIYSSPSIYNGSIYFGSSDRSIYCVGDRLPGITVKIDLNLAEITSDDLIMINFTVSDHNGVSLGDAAVRFTSSSGGFTSDPSGNDPASIRELISDGNGKGSIVYVPMKVSSRSTIDIVASASYAGLPDGSSVVRIIVEPGSDSGEGDSPSVIDLGGERRQYMLLLAAVVMIDILIAGLLVYLKLGSRSGEGDEGVKL